MMLLCEVILSTVHAEKLWLYYEFYTIHIINSLFVYVGSYDGL